MIRAYAASVLVTFGLVVVGAVGGVMPFPTIIALAAVPLALPVYRGLVANYENPYALMPAMAKNIQLHMATGLLLVVGYVIAIIADHDMASPPFFLS